MAKRPKLRLSAERHVLLGSRRQCALCFGLLGDSSEKRGQVAHLDRDATNNDVGNLVYLCLDHHDLYDSWASQTKRLRPYEVEYYRDRLYEAVSDIDSLPSPGGSDELAAQNQKRELLRTLHDNVKEWYHELVSDVQASLEKDRCSEDAQGMTAHLSFDYVWSRKHLPVVVAVVDSLRRFPSMAGLIDAIQLFLYVITNPVPANENDVAPSVSWLPDPSPE